MKNKNPILMALLLMLCVSIQAQVSNNTCGGHAIGDGGNSSYSVGQLVTSTHSSSYGTISEGVQQPFEILVVNGIENHSVILGINAYPNPVTNYLVLNIDDNQLSNNNYKIAINNIDGKTIRYQTIDHQETQIDMQNQPAGVYLLNITSQDQQIKTFKIIKNQ